MLDATLTHKRGEKSRVGWAAALQHTVQVLDCGDSLARAKRYVLMGATIWAAPARLNSYAQGMDDPSAYALSQIDPLQTPQGPMRIGGASVAPTL